MARKSISEYQAKKLLFSALNFSYSGVQVHSNQYDVLTKLDTSKHYIVKVDTGIKKRNKKGLIVLNVDITKVKTFIQELSQNGFHQFLVEEFIPHQLSDEKYIAIERVRFGYQILYSDHGGVDIEKNEDSIKKHLVKNNNDLSDIAALLSVSSDFLQKILILCDKNHFSFLEINPLVCINNRIYLLDVAAEVDTAGEFFAQAWNSTHFTHGSVKPKTAEEIKVEKLSEKSPASLKYEIINPNGSIFLLLSGGGASIVIADEIHQQGFGDELANYGEYSGNPTEEETYLYTTQLLSSLLKSEAQKKVLIIGGGVANFTDIRKTFLGIIRALREVHNKLSAQHVKIFVRRGGPHQKEGLLYMEEFLKEVKLYGDVSGPEKMLTSVVTEAMTYLHHDTS